MKLSTFAYAAAFALSALALNATADAATMSLGKNSYKLDPADANAAKACTDKGGTVADAGGVKTCTLPPACVVATAASSSYAINTADPNAEKACTDACGTVSKDASGAKVCVKPGASAAAAPSGVSREPHN